MESNTNTQPLDFVKGRLRYQITQVSKNKFYYRRQAFRVFMSTTFLSSFVTLLLSLNIKEISFFSCPPIRVDEFIRVLALIITSAITVISAYNSFFNHKEIWVANNQALNRLYKLNDEIEYAEVRNKEITLEQIDSFKKEYQNIFNELNSSWEKNRLPNKSPDDK